jgi:ferrous iron transport protein A
MPHGRIETLMQDEARDICREDCEEAMETLYRLECDGRGASLSDLMQEPDLSGRPVADIVMELALNGHVEVSGDTVTLTPRGRDIGQRMYSRHELAEKLLRSLGLRESSAHEEACRVEHMLDDDAVADAVKRLDRFETMLDNGVLRLADANPGDYQVVFLTTGRTQRRRLEDMGIGQGALLRVWRKQPRGPIEVEAHGARLALGRGVASKILVTPHLIYPPTTRADS